MRYMYSLSRFPDKCILKPPWRPTRPSLILTEHIAMLYLMTNRVISDGLGGFFGVTNTTSLGAKKRLKYKKFYFFLILLFL